MLKNILISGLLCTFLSAESFIDKAESFADKVETVKHNTLTFDAFLQNAIRNSPYLKSSALAVKQAKEEGSALKRYKNPSLEFEYSRLEPATGDKDNGYRVNYSQPIRLWSIADDKKALANAIIKNANASYLQKKALFIRDISLRFTSYSRQRMLLKLGNEELLIAKNIYDISKARYELGTITRALMLQAQIDYEMVQIANEYLELNSNKEYYKLLRLAGINTTVQLEEEHIFALDKAAKDLVNPSLQLLQTQKNISISEAKVNSNSIEWINIFAEYEKEPEQNIARIGLNFPLGIFNTRSQEQKIASLQASRSKLLLDNETKQLDIETKRLMQERSHLKGLLRKNEKILKTEMELLHMFEDGYKIANINLLELQDIKNRVISTKKSLIQIKTALNQNAIFLNYNQGSYNE